MVTLILDYLNNEDLKFVKHCVIVRLINPENAVY